MCPEEQKLSRAKSATTPVWLSSQPCLQGITRGGVPAWALGQVVNQARRRRTVLAPSMEIIGLKSCIEQCLRADALPWELGELKAVVGDH